MSCNDRFITDLQALLQGLCTEQTAAICAEEFVDLTWACARCPRMRVSDLSGYTLKLVWISDLRAAGFPISANDLTLEEWLDLGRLEEIWRRMRAA